MLLPKYQARQQDRLNPNISFCEKQIHLAPDQLRAGRERGRDPVVDPEGRFTRIVPDPARRSSQTTPLETSSILRRIDQQLFCKTIC